MLFSNLSPGLLFDRVFQCIIELEIGSKLFMNVLYYHPQMYREEKENITKQLLEMDHIRPSSSSFESYVVLLKSKDGM